VNRGIAIAPADCDQRRRSVENGTTAGERPQRRLRRRAPLRSVSLGNVPLTMIVHRLQLAHLEAYFALRLAALEHAPMAFVTTLDEERARGPARFAATLQARDDEGALLGALANGHLVGIATIHRGDRARTRHKAFITGMYVDIEHRKQGIGGRILDFAVTYAREPLGASVVGLSLEAANEAARRLYTSRGFVAWGVEPRGRGQTRHEWLDAGSYLGRHGVGVVVRTDKRAHDFARRPKGLLDAAP
jgi:GNAT superfamily N-acetyltransferase